MTKFALLVHDHYVPLLREGGTLESAIKIALEIIYDGEVAEDDGNLDFEVIEITKIHHYNTSNYQDYFEKRWAEWNKRQQEQQDRLDKEQFERLKKKFEK